MKLLAGILIFVTGLSSILGASPSSHSADQCPNTSVLLRTFRLTVSCNITTLKEKQLKDIQAPVTNIYLPLLYLVTFSVGLPSNLMALWVLVFRTKLVPSTLLLINLTIADCLLLLVLPFRIVYHFRGNHWELGEPFCRVVMAVFYGNMYGSTWFLALVAIDRYVALVHPFKAQTLRTQRMSVYMTMAGWMVVLAAMLPLLISQQTYVLDKPQITTCHDALPEKEHEKYFLPYFSTLFAFCFLLPFAIILFCHGAVLRTLVAERKQYAHAIRVTVLVLLVFIMCFLPSNVLLLFTYADNRVDGNGEDIYIPYVVSLAVSTFNSCIDPFIFYFVSTEFRQKLKSCLRCSGDSQGQPSSQGNISLSKCQRTNVTLLSMTS